MAQRILITGVSGFVGSAVAHVFAAHGWQVRGFARASSARTNLTEFPGELATGDIRDETAVRAALAGCDALAHVAADYRLWAPDPEDIVRQNVAGTTATMRAAKAAGTPRIVYTSSVATLTPGRDETARLTPETAVGAYKRSKVLAERIVDAMVVDGLPAVIVNPSTPIGPRDVKPTPTGRVLTEAARGKVPAFVDTGLNIVHVDDCAEGHRLALEHGVPGRRYILGGDDVTLAALLAEVAGLCGRPAPTMRLPRAPLMPFAWGAEQVARVTGREPMLTRDALRMSRYLMYFPSARAEAELGYTHRPWTDAVADALAWFRAAGMV